VRHTAAKLTVGAILLIAGAAAGAGAWSTTPVRITALEVSIVPPDVQFTKLLLSGSTGKKPASCTDAQIGFPMNTETGKALLSVAQGAFLSGKTIKVRYTGVCETTTAIFDGIFVE